MNKRKIIIAWILNITWIVMIFLLSNQPAVTSDQLSLGLLHRILMIVGIDSVYHLAFLNFLIRKFAHFSAYLILGVLMTNTLVVTFNLKSHIYFMMALILCGIYAASDEFHQLFVIGRSCQVSDVLLDIFGSLVGIGIFFIIRKIIVSHNMHKNKENIN